MQPSRHLEWTSRALLLLSRFILHQLPASYGVEVDAQKFLEAISMNIEGRRYPVGYPKMTLRIGYPLLRRDSSAREITPSVVKQSVSMSLYRQGRAGTPPLP